MKRFVMLTLCTLMILLCFAGCDKSADGGDYSKGIHHAVIDIKGYGEVELELDADTAPITVANFVKLAKDGFYDGLTFHRMQADFVLQGGDPQGNGMGDSGENIKGEFLANGVENDISHKRGVISMARGGYDYNSASCQFFIVLSDNYTSSLDGLYASFGRVTKGMDVVDKVCADLADAPTDSMGMLQKADQPIISKITIKD